MNAWVSQDIPRRFVVPTDSSQLIHTNLTFSNNSCRSCSCLRPTSRTPDIFGFLYESRTVDRLSALAVRSAVKIPCKIFHFWRYYYNNNWKINPNSKLAHFRHVNKFVVTVVFIVMAALLQSCCQSSVAHFVRHLWFCTPSY